MNLAAFTFRKDERLKRKKQIDHLFASGRSFFSYPFKLVWAIDSEEGPFPAKVLISVSRRTIKKAAGRNRIKRLVREAYRHEKPRLYMFLSEQNISINIGIIYTGHEMIDFEQAREKINRMISRLMKELRAN